MRLWCEHAWLGGPRVESGVVIETAGDRIVGVATEAGPPPADAERLAGLVLPGLVNVHSHAFHRALRGRTHAGRSFWSWREQMYALAATLTPDSYLPLAAAVYGEMALAGITTVGEFHYLHHGPGGVPYDEPNTMSEVLAEATRVAGLRLTLLDTCYLHGGIGRDLDAVQRRFSDQTAEAWAERTATAQATLPSATVSVGAAIHSVRAVEPAEMAIVRAWADERGAVVHAHVSEQPAENEACLAAFGRTPVGLLADADIIGSAFTAVHATHLDDADTAALGGAGASVCFCPTTERDLADGAGPARALVDKGAHLCLGSDSHAVVDLLEEARAVELDERLVTGERGHHRSADLLGAATAAGAAALGWTDTGALAVGRLADLIAIDTTGVRLAGSSPKHLLDATVFAASADDVRDVMVGGRWIVRDGHHLTLDVAGALAAAISEVWA